MTTRIDPWDKQPNESAPAFEAFVVYRDLGIERSTARVARELSKSKSLMDRWSSAHSWVIRSSAWDQEQDRVYRLTLTKKRRDMADRHAKLANAAQAKIVTRLNSIRPEDLSPADLIRWLEISAKIERAALGEPDRVEVSGGPTAPGSVDSTALSDEERRTRMEMLRRELNSRLGHEEGVPA